MSDVLIAAVAAGIDVIDLAVPLESGMTCSPNHPGFRLALSRRHGDVFRADGTSAASEIMVTGGHVGTHIDALGHFSNQGLLYGGASAANVQAGGRLVSHDVLAIPAGLRRAVLFDVAGFLASDVLDAETGISANTLRDIASQNNINIQPGDVVVIRTGWIRHFADRDRFLGFSTGVPGITLDAAEWLADAGVFAVGADTTSCEQIHPEVGHSLLPVHEYLLVECGIHLIEVLMLETLAVRLAKAARSEFTIVIAPLPVVGATGAPLRPLALIA